MGGRGKELFINLTWVLPFTEMANLAEGFVQENLGPSPFLASLLPVWGWEVLYFPSLILTRDSEDHEGWMVRLDVPCWLWEVTRL